MLRKLFPSGPQSSNNNSTPVAKQSRALEKEEWNERTGFSHCAAELDQFESRLRELLQTLTRQCQAITELCASTAEFTDQLSGLFFDPIEPPLSRPIIEETLGLVNMFRVSAIAPLQSALIMVPQVRLHCDHRQGAMQLMMRYQRKVNEMERTSKSKAESSRLQRNRAKLQSATARFRDLDVHVQQEIRALVSKDITTMVGGSVNELLIRAQLLMGQMAVASANRMHQLVAPHDKNNAQQASDGQVVKALEEPQDQTPQRRMAMIVVPESYDNNTYVRQSILAPPTSVMASDSYRSPSTTTTTSTDDCETEGHDDDANVTIREDVGIGKRKKHVHGTRTWDIHQHIKENLSIDIDPAECVRLPEGFARDEWIAVHVVDFFNEINLLYGTISEFCTAEGCPQMSAGPCYSYMWANSTSQSQQVSASSPSNLPASQYVAKLMDWIESQINDPSIFPADGSTYARHFETETASVILKRLFRVYAHMYHSHLDHFAELSAETHLGFCFQRFILFIREFDLVEQKELNALRKLIQSVLENPITCAHGPETQ